VKYTMPSSRMKQRSLKSLHQNWIPKSKNRSLLAGISCGSSNPGWENLGLILRTTLLGSSCFLSIPGNRGMLFCQTGQEYTCRGKIGRGGFALLATSHLTL
jgi:hypothetical protein